MRENFHPSEQELLLVLDGELSSSRTATIRSHLRDCWRCRTRMAGMEATIVAFTHAYQNENRSAPPADIGRARLKAQLAGMRKSPKGWYRIDWRTALTPFAILFIALVGLYEFRNLAEHRLPGRGDQKARATPLAFLTPGAVRPVSNDEVCEASGADGARAVPDSLKREVFTEYGMAGAKADAFEVDFLVTPELGGTRDIRNLWPQPYGTVLWNAHVKDALEERLHEMVCSGQIDLATAQSDLSKDWISAYKKYFHSEKPL